MSIKIWPYKQGSKSAKVLRNTISSILPSSNCRVLLPEVRSRWRGTQNDTLINWGNSGEPRDTRATIINRPNMVRNWSNKLTAYLVLEQQSPDNYLCFTIHKEIAETWNKVVCRTQLHGHSGEGIIICQQGEELPDAPVYTHYYRKRREYRIHFVRIGHYLSILTQQKRRSTSIPDDQVNWEIRNHNNGFIYAVDNINRIADDDWNNLLRSINFISTFLDFGAVDVIEVNDSPNNPEGSQNTFKILEVNTAAGIESPTVANFYATNFIRRAQV